jgi:DNA repair ATPase RecN
LTRRNKQKELDEFIKHVDTYKEIDRKLNHVREELFDAIGEVIELIEQTGEPNTRTQAIEVLDTVLNRLNLSITRVTNYMKDIER